MHRENPCYTSCTMEKILVHSPLYNTNLSEFGIDKPFALDRGERVLSQLELDYGEPITVLTPCSISDEDVLLVHTDRYLQSLQDKETWMHIFEFKSDEYHPEKASKKLPELKDDIFLKAGGTLLACQTAIETGLAANLGGGYHHAFPDEGRGFCVIHDIAIAIRKLQKTGQIEKAMVVDLDFHQGDGTALIFQNDPTVFTLSVHSEEGFPEDKQKSDMDVSLFSSETPKYLERTKEALNQALTIFKPDLTVFVAGSDPYEKDVLPGTRFIKLSLETLETRDKLVIDTFNEHGIPLAMVFAGGYGPDVWEVHYRAVRHLYKLYRDKELASV